MTVWISILLIYAGCTGFMVGLLWFLYQIPLRLDLSFSKNQRIFNVLFQVSWGFLNMQVLPSLSIWHIKGQVGHVTLISQPIQRGTISFEDFSVPEKLPDFDDLKQLCHNFIKFLPEIYHHIQLKKISADITYGLGDPACTGCTYGYYHAFRPLVTSEKFSINLTPDFEHLVLDGTVEAGIHIINPLVLCIRGSRQMLPDIIRIGRSLHD